MGDCTNTPPPIFSDGGNHRYDGLVEAAIAEDAMTVASLNSMTRSIGSDSTLKADTIPEFEKLRIDYAKLEQELPNIITTHPILHAYLMEQSQDYRYVTLWRRKGWASEEGDKHFMMLREKADNPDDHTQEVFYNQMCHIGQDMDEEYNLSLELELSGDTPLVLDLCMAPGGFSGTILDNARGSQICGVSLPVEKGGHPLCIEDWERRGVKVHWLDITMLSAEMGREEMPSDHPECSQFLTLRPYFGQEFALIFCDGNALRTHIRPSYREEKERHRLLTSQLVLAFQRIRNGGTLVCRFHKIESVETAMMLQLFSTFSNVQAFKPRSIHGARSSFYMVAKDVEPQHLRAIEAVKSWKKEWIEATLNTEEQGHSPAFDNEDPARIEKAREIIQNFGQELIDLAKPIWKIQANCLRNKPFFTGRQTRFNDGGHHLRRRRPLNHGSYTRVTQGRAAKDNWRSSEALKENEPQTTLPTSTAKEQRHPGPQQTHGLYLDSDHKKVENFRSRTFYESGVPTNSGFWKGDPRTAVKDELKDISNDSPLRESQWPIMHTHEALDDRRLAVSPNMTLNTPDLGRLIAPSKRSTTTFTGRPGGSLLNSSTTSIRQLHQPDSNSSHPSNKPQGDDPGVPREHEALNANKAH